METTLETSTPSPNTWDGQLTALNKIGQAVTSSLDLTEVLQRILDHTLQLVKAEVAVILLPNDTGELTFTAAKGVDAQMLQGKHISSNVGAAGEVLRTGQAVYVMEATEDDNIIYRDFPPFSHFYTRSLLAVPLRLGNETIGILEALHRQPTAFNDGDVQVLAAVANWVAIAIDNVHQYDNLRRRWQESAAIAEISQALNESLQLEQVFQLIANTALRIIPRAERTVIHLLDETAQVLRPITVTEGGETNPVGLMMRPGEGIAGRVILEGKLINVPDTDADPQFLRGRRFSGGALLVTPIQNRWGKVGTITVQSASPHAFSADDERLLSILGQQAALAIQNARLFEAEQRARRVAETLRAANVALTETLELNRVLDTLLDYVYVLIPYDSASVVLVENDQLVVSVLRGYEQWGQARLLRQAIAERRFPPLNTVLFSRRSMLVSNVREYKEWSLLPETLHVKSWLGVPLLAGGKVIGLYTMEKVVPDYFTAEHQRLAEALAAQAAVAVQNALLYEKEQKQYLQLQKSQVQLIHAEKMGALGRLTASIAHEINNPIQAIQGCITLTMEELAGNKDEETINLYLDIVKSELNRVATIVRNMRDFYRLGQDGFQVTDVHATLDSVLLLASKQMQQSRVLLERSWVEELPFIQANPDHLKQVFINLILNAVDAMPQGGRLKIRTTLGEMQGLRGKMVTAVCIEFADSGLGMSPETVSHLFEPFFTTKEGGSGLGLSISYGIIEAHQGTITAVSEVGAGTTFTILLPVMLQEEKG